MKIVVVGGGTAGWLAALMLKSVHTNSHEITVIESSKIGIVGAGEGSTGYLLDIIQGVSWDYGCNEGDFLQNTNATIKMGIRHKDWRVVGEHYDAPLDSPSRNSEGTDYSLMYAILNDIPMHLMSEDGFYIENSLSGYKLMDGVLTSQKSHAYHFDARLVGQYFKSVCGKSVTHIDSEIVDVDVLPNGSVSSVTLSDGRVVEGDFFIDASGFSRVLAKALDVGWKSYRDNLPLDTAMPFFLPLGEKIDPVTTAWAQKNGWMWQIPTQERYGCGYVFDSRFIDEDGARTEIETALGQEIEPIRFLKFDAGRSDVLWKNNVLFVGLSAAFAEPLEATSIHTTIVQLKTFVFECLRDTPQETINFGVINTYNKRMIQMYDDMMNFINIHYAGGRTDSEFWRWISTGETLTDQSKNFIEMHKSRSLQPGDLPSYYGSAGSGLYNWIMAGLGIIDKNLAKRELVFYGQDQIASDIWLIAQHTMGAIKDGIISNTDFIDGLRGGSYANCFSQ